MLCYSNTTELFPNTWIHCKENRLFFLWHCLAKTHSDTTSFSQELAMQCGGFFPQSYATGINLAYYPEPTAQHVTSYCFPEAHHNMIFTSFVPPIPFIPPIRGDNSKASPDQVKRSNTFKTGLSVQLHFAYISSNNLLQQITKQYLFQFQMF